MHVQFTNQLIQYNHSDACALINQLIQYNHSDACALINQLIQYNHSDACALINQLIQYNHSDACALINQLIQYNHSDACAVHSVAQRLVIHMCHISPQFFEHISIIIVGSLYFLDTPSKFRRLSTVTLPYKR